MIAQITEGVKVTVQTEFQGEYSNPGQDHYVFTYKMKPTNVMIHLYHDPSSKTNWIFVKPK